MQAWEKRLCYRGEEMASGAQLAGWRQTLPHVVRDERRNAWSGELSADSAFCFPTVLHRLSDRMVNEHCSQINNMSCVALSSDN